MDSNEIIKVDTMLGFKWHYSADGKRTLCGRDVASGSDGNGEGCKRCITATEKLAENRERTEYAAKLRDTQDDVMSQAVCMHGNGSDCAPCEADDAAALAEGPVVATSATDTETAAQWAAVAAGEAHYASFDATPIQDAPADRTVPYTDIMATRKSNGARFVYATVKAADVQAVAYYVTLARTSGAVTDVTTRDSVDVAMWETEDAEDSVAVAAQLAEHKAEPVPDMVIEISRHHVSYYAPADHSECSHTTAADSEHDADCNRRWPCTSCGVDPSCTHFRECTCELSDSECDSVGGRSLEGDRRETSPYTTEVIRLDADAWEEADRTPSVWVKNALDGRASLDTYGLTWESSGSPIGYHVESWQWMSARDSNQCDTDGEETVMEFTVRLTDGWDTYQRGQAFRLITGQK